MTDLRPLIIDERQQRERKNNLELQDINNSIETIDVEILKRGKEIDQLCLEKCMTEMLLEKLKLHNQMEQQKKKKTKAEKKRQ